jgi:hypothetical protein
MNTPQIKIYDNQGRTLDRFTIAFLNHKNERNGLVECLSTCSTGRSVWMHDECLPSRHLGSLVSFENLPWELKGQIKLYLEDRFQMKVSEMQIN